MQNLPQEHRKLASRSVSHGCGGVLMGREALQNPADSAQLLERAARHYALALADIREILDPQKQTAESLVN